MRSSASEVTARIVYWGSEGAGKSESLRTIHSKLKANHRGDLKRIPTRLDPTVTYEEFPIQLGSISGVRTQLRVVAVPGAAGLGPSRKQLLDEVDGIVLVLDARRERLEANLECVEELRRSLEAYGRSLDDIPLVVQYNKRDLGDPFTIEELHRRLRLRDAAVFETVATEGSGILQALTTISKQVVRVMRERTLEPEPVPAARKSARGACAAAESTPSLTAPMPASSAPTLGNAGLMEQAILEAEAIGDEAQLDADAVLDARAVLDEAWPAEGAAAKPTAGARIGADLRIVSVGSASREGERAIRVPLVLGNDEGESVTLALTIRLDPLLDEEPA